MNRASNHPIVDHGPSRPMVSVLRFCGLEGSSIAAGIRSGLAALRSLGKDLGGPMGPAYVIYRNRQPSSVTVEVGMPLPEGTAYRNTGEFRSGRTPKGAALQGGARAWGDGLVEAQTELCELARDEGLEHEPYWWQVFQDTGDLDWVYDPPAINLPVRVPA